MIVERGSDLVDKRRAAVLFWNAFREKLSFSMGPEHQALIFIEKNMHPQFSFTASEGEKLLGLIGFKTDKGGLIGGDFNDLRRVYGSFSSLWRMCILSLFERDLRHNQLLLDGIFVAPEARGRGIGSELIATIKSFARREGFDEIRLDVIDTNPRAKQLYERLGFQPAGEIRTGVLSKVLGFKSATTMVYSL